MKPLHRSPRQLPCRHLWPLLSGQVPRTRPLSFKLRHSLRQQSCSPHSRLSSAALTRCDGCNCKHTVCTACVWNILIVRPPQDAATLHALSKRLVAADADMAAVQAGACAASADLQRLLMSVESAWDVHQLPERRSAVSAAAGSQEADVDRQLHGLLSRTRQAMRCLEAAIAERVCCFVHVDAGAASRADTCLLIATATCCCADAGHCARSGIKKQSGSWLRRWQACASIFLLRSWLFSTSATLQRRHQRALMASVSHSWSADSMSRSLRYCIRPRRGRLCRARRLTSTATSAASPPCDTSQRGCVAGMPRRLASTAVSAR